ncbi:MAG TPA: hypothetical protein VGN04_00780 [Herbaspirillum sp.]
MLNMGAAAFDAAAMAGTTVGNGVDAFVNTPAWTLVCLLVVAVVFVFAFVFVFVPVFSMAFAPLPALVCAPACVFINTAADTPAAGIAAGRSPAIDACDDMDAPEEMDTVAGVAAATPRRGCQDNSACRIGKPGCGA